MTVFEQHERWLEELRQHVDKNEAVTSGSGRMNLVAIAAEVVDDDADERKQTRIHVPNWQSLASDLNDTLQYLGTETSTQVGPAVTALVSAIADLFVIKPDQNGNPQTHIDAGKRPRVKMCAATLFDLLDQDSTIIAAWRDLESLHARTLITSSSRITGSHFFATMSSRCRSTAARIQATGD